jgi:hypothetical protein
MTTGVAKVTIAIRTVSALATVGILALALESTVLAEEGLIAPYSFLRIVSRCNAAIFS